MDTYSKLLFIIKDFIKHGRPLNLLISWHALHGRGNLGSQVLAAQRRAAFYPIHSIRDRLRRHLDTQVITINSISWLVGERNESVRTVGWKNRVWNCTRHKNNNCNKVSWEHIAEVNTQNENSTRASGLRVEPNQKGIICQASAALLNWLLLGILISKIVVDLKKSIIWKL